MREWASPEGVELIISELRFPDEKQTLFDDRYDYEEAVAYASDPEDGDTNLLKALQEAYAKHLKEKEKLPLSA